MECITENQLLELLDGHLSGSVREEIEGHIDECGECRRLLGNAARAFAAEPSSRAASETPEAPAGLLRGTMVQDRYVVLDLVGFGGMGVVHSAYDRVLDRKVALKLLRPELVREAAGPAASRMLREAQTVARLSHPNIIVVHDVGTFGEQIFIALEFVDGQTLRQWLARDPRPLQAEILRAFLDAGRGLAAAHAAGVIHRDFKPDNVLIGRDGRVHVSDFGLARSYGPMEPRATGEPDGHLSSTMTRTGALIGTPAYMAPEQFRGERASAAADQFAFCVALYEALYGEMPFASRDDPAFRERVLGGRLRRPPREGTVPPRLRAVLARGLQSAPSARYPSMSMLCDELARAAGRRRWPWVLAVGGAAAALAVALSLVSSNESRCQGAESRLAGVWDRPRKQQVRDAFVAVGGDSAEKTFTAVEAALDDHLRRWVAVRTDACAATHLRGEQSEELLDERMSCLDQGLAETGALIDLFTRPDAAMIERAVGAVGKLSSPTGCDTASALAERRLPQPPLEAAARAQELKTRALRVRALQLAGRSAEALPLAHALAKDASALGYRPREHTSINLLGRIQADVGEFAPAEQTLLRALLLGEALDADERLILDDLLGLAGVIAAQGRFAQALPWAQLASAKIDRLRRERPGFDDDLASQAAMSLGNLLLELGRYGEAETQFRQAIELRQKQARPVPTELATTHVAFGNVLLEQGRAREALEHYRHALTLRERELGQVHTRVAGVLNNIGRALQEECRWDEALAAYQQALAIRRRVYRGEHFEVAAVHTNLGGLYRELGRLDEALAELQRSRAMLEKFLAPEHPTFAEVFVELASVRLAQGAPDEALALAERALRTTEARRGVEHPHTVAALLMIGDARLARGEGGFAVEALERAWRTLDAVPRDRRSAAVAFALARALWGQNEDRPRARQLAGDALAWLPRCRVSERARMEDWIASHNL